MLQLIYIRHLIVEIRNNTYIGLVKFKADSSVGSWLSSIEFHSIISGFDDSILSKKLPNIDGRKNVCR